MPGHRRYAQSVSRLIPNAYEAFRGARRTSRSADAGQAPLNSAEAKARALELLPLVEELRRDGAVTVRALTQALNERGVEGPRGGRWHVSTVHRLLSRTSS